MLMLAVLGCGDGRAEPAQTGSSPPPRKSPGPAGSLDEPVPQPRAPAPGRVGELVVRGFARVERDTLVAGTAIANPTARPMDVEHGVCPPILRLYRSRTGTGSPAWRSDAHLRRRRSMAAARRASRSAYARRSIRTRNTPRPSCASACRSPASWAIPCRPVRTAPRWTRRGGRWRPGSWSFHAAGATFPKASRGGRGERSEDAEKASASALFTPPRPPRSGRRRSGLAQREEGGVRIFVEVADNDVLMAEEVRRFLHGGVADAEPEGPLAARRRKRCGRRNPYPWR
jgi:hypothetical protein